MSSSNLYPQAAPIAQAVTISEHVIARGVPMYHESLMPLCAVQDHPMPAVHASEALQALAGCGFPRGLASEVVSSAHNSFPIRLWIVDNSGSMQTGDGSRMVQTSNGSRMIQATRWQELADTLGAVAEMACALGARTDFLLLNRPSTGQLQFATVGGKGTGNAALVPVLGVHLEARQLKQAMQQLQPSGGTPLTEAVQQACNLIEIAAPALLASGQQAVVTLATDGLPNDNDTFMRALQRLQGLPVWLVVRLCTNDEGVVRYWSDLDQSLEMPLEVLDDERGEAQEIHALNPWLTYGPPLHLAREFGLKHRLFDLLDETRLMPSQARELCEVLLGCGPLPEPELEWSAFMSALRTALLSAPSTVDPSTGRRRAWIDLRRIGRLRPGYIGCPCL